MITIDVSEAKVGSHEKSIISCKACPERSRRVAKAQRKRSRFRQEKSAETSPFWLFSLAALLILTFFRGQNPLLTTDAFQFLGALSDDAPTGLSRREKRKRVPNFETPPFLPTFSAPGKAITSRSDKERQFV